MQRISNPLLAVLLVLMLAFTLGACSSDGGGYHAPRSGAYVGGAAGLGQTGDDNVRLQSGDR